MEALAREAGLQRSPATAFWPSTAVNLSSWAGKADVTLLDPENVTISTAQSSNMSCSNGICEPTGDNSILNVMTLEGLLTADLDVTTGGRGSLGEQAGNITIAAPVAWSADTTLTLDAFHSIPPSTSR